MSIILNAYKAKQVMEGGGVLVNRIFGYYETEAFDPFLMLDYFESPEPMASAGFPWHPHKGIETISYFIRGSGKHEDSMGNSGTIGPNELQWMSAARGIMHQEMPGPSPEGVQGFQFWVNLPSAEKLKAPGYQYINRGEMVKVHETGKEIKVIAGTYNDHVGPIDQSARGITMLHVKVESNYEIMLKRDPDKQGFLFLFEGSGTINEEAIHAIAAYTLDEGELRVCAKDESIEFIFAQGIPIKEPIAWRGPIVMNTQEEVETTFRDLENGTFIKV